MFSKSTNAATSLRPVVLPVVGACTFTVCTDWDPFVTSKPGAGVATDAPFSSCSCNMKLPGPIPGISSRCADDGNQGSFPVVDYSPCVPYAQSLLIPNHYRN